MVKQDGCHNHSKTRHLCQVFKWSAKLRLLIEKKNIFDSFHIIEPFENQTGNRMVKDHLKTGHKCLLFKCFGIWMSGFQMIPVLRKIFFCIKWSSLAIIKPRP
jgi:hypothetical protein